MSVVALLSSVLDAGSSPAISTGTTIRYGPEKSETPEKSGVSSFCLVSLRFSSRAGFGTCKNFVLLSMLYGDFRRFVPVISVTVNHIGESSL